MTWSGSLLLTCWLFLAAALAGGAQAARTHQQRRAFGDPQVLLPPGVQDGIASGTAPKSLGEQQLTLRHIYHHGSHQYPHLHRYVDVPNDAQLQITGDDGDIYEADTEPLTVKSQTTIIQRLAQRNESDINHLLAHADWYGVPADLPADAWTEDEVKAPNVTDKSTVLTFAKIAANAYVLKREDGEWQPVKGGFNYTDDFGWEKDGLRGHIFADETNATVVIGLKGTSTWLDNLPGWLGHFMDSSEANVPEGTSPAVFDGADTTGNDKLNDNLFGSCCCGQGGALMWKQVCDCMTDTYTCNSTCLVRSLREKSHYYRAVRELYGNVTERYPNSDVWLSGHSLGGVVSSLLGLTYGLPTLTFEAFPDAMAASRLGLPTPPGYKIGSHQARSKTGVYHFGHTADPIYMGTCNGASSFCTIAGYAFEGLCHTGQTCIYDTVGDLGWRVAIGTHKIVNVIKDVIKKYDTVPGCDQDEECQDCLLWKFDESNGTQTTTSTATSTSTSSRTRTETCKTPGWWGCLDESTTITTPTTTFTTTVTSSTCLDPGWFGCRDPSTTTFTSTVTRPEASPAPTVTTTLSLPTSTSSSTTCKTPGFFGGCNDPTTTSSQSAKPSSTVSTTTATQTSECTSREWFGLICVDPSPTTAASATPSPTNLPTTRRKHCAKRHWYGTCKEWRFEDFDPKNDL